MFVVCDPETAPWRQINSTYGVSRMLSFAEGPKPMPEALIAGLRARCDSVGKVVPLEDFEAGQSVEMHSGPFANFIATVEQMASDARVWVLLDFMGKATRVQVDRQQSQAVSPAAE
jgi:transcriptional antiterminator RfaH